LDLKKEFKKEIYSIDDIEVLKDLKKSYRNEKEASISSNLFSIVKYAIEEDLMYKQSMIISRDIIHNLNYKLELIKERMKELCKQ